jgi:hypothetical protein
VTVSGRTDSGRTLGRFDVSVGDATVAVDVNETAYALDAGVVRRTEVLRRVDAGEPVGINTLLALRLQRDSLSTTDKHVSQATAPALMEIF